MAIRAITDHPTGCPVIARYRAEVPVPRTGMGELPDLSSMLGGVSLQTIALLALAAYLIYRLLFSSGAKNRRKKLAEARRRYYDEVRKIKQEYR